MPQVISTSDSAPASLRAADDRSGWISDLEPSVALLYYLPGAVDNGQLGSSYTKSIGISKGPLYNTKIFAPSVGLEIQARRWMGSRNSLGFAGSIGVSTWNLSSEYKSGFSTSTYGSGWTYAYDGGIRIVPVGGSVLWRPFETDSSKFTIEGGFRYIFVSSDVTMTTQQRYLQLAGYVPYVNTANYVTRYSTSKESLAFDSLAIGVLAANYEYSIWKSAAIFAGAGYQFGITKGDVNNLGENDLGGWFIKGGMSWRFR